MIAAVEERSSNPLRYEFQADERSDRPARLDPHTLAFALAAEEPRILASSAGDPAYALACPIRVAGASRGFILVEGEAPIAPQLVEIVETAAVMVGQEMLLLRHEAAESTKDRALALMLETARVLSAADPDNIFETVHELIGRVMDAPIFVATLADPETGELAARYYADYGNVSAVHAIVPERGPVAEAFRTRKTVCVFRPSDWDRYQAINLAGPDVPHAPSAIFAPLKIGESALGVISIQCRRQNAYAQTDADILTSIAEQVAIAVQGARVARAGERRAADLSLLLEVARVVSSELDARAVFARIGDGVRRCLEAPVFIAALWAGESDMVDLEYFIEGDVEHEPRQYPIEQSLLAPVLRTGASLLIRTAEERDRAPWVALTTPIRSQSIIAVPMTAGGRVIGAISAQSYEPYAYDKRHVEIMRAIGEQAGVAVRNAQLFEQAKRGAKSP